MFEVGQVWQWNQSDHYYMIVDEMDAKGFHELCVVRLPRSNNTSVRLGHRFRYLMHEAGRWTQVTPTDEHKLIAVKTALDLSLT